MLNLELYYSRPIAYLKYPIPLYRLARIGIHNTVAISANTLMYSAVYDYILIAWFWPGIPMISNFCDYFDLMLSKRGP
jgi:hypothetical protein